MFDRLKNLWNLILDYRTQKINRRTLVVLLVTAFIALFLLLCALLIAGAHQSKQRAEEAAKPEILNLRGYIYHGPEVSAFRKCDGIVEYWVTGNLGIDLWKIYSDLAPEEYQPVYIEMKAQLLLNEPGVKRADYVGEVLVKEVYHLAYESLGCEMEKNYNYLLHGNEPFWNIIIDENRGVFIQQLGTEEIYATYAKPTKIDNGIQYDLISGSSPITIKIREIDTYDSMSGAYYGYSAYVKLKDKVYYGTALLGRPTF